MRAMVLPKVVSLNESTSPLELRDLPVPQAQAGEVRVRIAACGVCHTEIDEIEGRAPPPKLPVILGHEIVGIVDQLGNGVATRAIGDRVGIGWITRRPVNGMRIYAQPFALRAATQTVVTLNSLPSPKRMRIQSQRFTRTSKQPHFCAPAQ